MGIKDIGSTDIGYKTSTDGLSLYLDARNQNSYPGTGTAWYDLSIGGNNVSTDRVYYESSPISCFTSSYSASSFGGIPDPPYVPPYIDFYAPNLTTITTVETVCQIINLNSVSNVIFGWDTYVVFVLNPQSTVGFTTLSVAGDYLASNQGLNIGQWYHLVFEMRSDVSYLNNKIWINNVQQTLTPANQPENVSNRNFNGGVGRINSYGAISQFYNYMGNNKYSIFKVYNRALTQAEITNSYNYYKPIYNLT
jgi:hypothetical protein